MGLLSRVKNKNSGTKYIISTAKEIGKDYWGSIVAKSKFFGLWMEWKSRLTWIRNNEKDAGELHNQLEGIVRNIPEDEWLSHLPSVKPVEGFSRDAKNILQKRGIVEYRDTEDDIHNPEQK